MKAVLIAVGFVVSINILGIAALTCLYVLCSRKEDWIRPSEIANTGITDWEIELLCGDEDALDLWVGLECACAAVESPERSQ